jgi:branched-subunit amino acid transport protein AzlD
MNIGNILFSSGTFFSDFGIIYHENLATLYMIGFGGVGSVLPSAGISRQCFGAKKTEIDLAIHTIQSLQAELINIYKHHLGKGVFLCVGGGQCLYLSL